MSRSEAIPASSRQLGALSYFFVALSGIVVLAWKRDDDFVRFHALQSILATLTFFGLGILLKGLAGLPVIGFLYAYLFQIYLIVLFIYWIYLMVRAYNGRREHVPYLGALLERYVSG